MKNIENNIKTKNVFLLTLCVFLLMSCGGTPRSSLPRASLSGGEKVVERSGQKPKWAFERPMFVEKGSIYASAMFTDSPNLGKGIEVASKLAQLKLVESMRVWLIDRFKFASEGLYLSQTELERIVRSTTGVVSISGLTHNKYYYEKKQVKQVFGSAYKYDCFALVEISVQDYLESLKLVLSKELAPELANELLSRLKGYDKSEEQNILTVRQNIVEEEIYE